MIDYKYQDGIIIIGSERAILNVERKLDGTEWLKGVFDLDNRRYYMFTEEELGRDVFVQIDNHADSYADTWYYDPDHLYQKTRFPSNYVLHDYAKHHDLKLRIKFMNACRAECYDEIITTTLSSRYGQYTKIVTRCYERGVERRINWYWRESEYTWVSVDLNKCDWNVYLPRCNGKNAVALTFIARYYDTDILATNYAAEQGLLPVTNLTMKLDYTQFSKALESMPTFLKNSPDKKNKKEAFKMEYKYHRIPQIKNVIIAEPYTTILWSDNTKTQVKCMDGDRFDPEHGFAMCVLKKIYEEPKKPNAYSKWLKGWVKKGVENGEKQKKKKQKKEKEECNECCDLSSFIDEH